MYQLNAAKLNERMQEMGMTRDDLIHRTGLSILTIKNAMSSDARVRDVTAEKIAEALGMPLEEFLLKGYIANCDDIRQACDKSLRDNLITVFTKNLRARAKQQGISRETLAECTGLSRREIFKLMNGQVNPRITTVYCMAKALDVSIEDLLTEGAVN